MSARRLLLDTNTILHVTRGKAVGRWLLQEVPELDVPGQCLTSRVVHGELWCFVTRAQAKGQPWGERKIRRLRDILAEIPTVELHDPGVVEYYAAVTAFTEVSHKPAKPMGKNDLWIAACAIASKATILTGDDDFDHLGDMKVAVSKYNTTKITAGNA